MIRRSTSQEKTITPRVVGEIEIAPSVAVAFMGSLKLRMMEAPGLTSPVPSVGCATRSAGPMESSVKALSVLSQPLSPSESKAQIRTRAVAVSTVGNAPEKEIVPVVPDPENSR